MRTLLVIILVLAGFMVSASLLSGCSNDRAQANELVARADDLRMSAAGKLSQATATIDSLMSGAAAGSAIAPDQTQAACNDAQAQLSSAGDDLNQQQAALDEAGALQLSENYRSYLSLLSQGNARMKQTIESANAMPAELLQDKDALAGWDEARAKQIAAQVRDREQQVSYSYAQAEILHGQAEDIRAQHPDDFS